MGEAEQATGLDGWKITYKTTHVKEYTVKASNRVFASDKRGLAVRHSAGAAGRGSRRGTRVKAQQDFANERNR